MRTPCNRIDVYRSLFCLPQDYGGSNLSLFEPTQQGSASGQQELDDEFPVSRENLITHICRVPELVPPTRHACVYRCRRLRCTERNDVDTRCMMHCHEVYVYVCRAIFSPAAAPLHCLYIRWDTILSRSRYSTVRRIANHQTSPQSIQPREPSMERADFEGQDARSCKALHRQDGL